MATRKFIFDTKLQDYVPNPVFDNDTPKLSVGDGTEDIIPDPNAIDDLPGGSSNDLLLPPDTFSVVEQITRNNPDGSTSVDVIIEVDDNGSGRQYEVRITR